MGVTFIKSEDQKRHCGDCQLCCKLLPVVEVDKKANQRCRHQKVHKGCQVYDKPAMPPCCKMWNCRWLVNDRTEALRRPDRAGYVIDILPDFVGVRSDVDGDVINLPVLQIWVDPARPGDWRKDDDLMRYIFRVALEDRMAALVREGSNVATFIAAPPINESGDWFESKSEVGSVTHRAQDFLDAGFSMDMVLEGKI
jgi:hypothetical protein